MFMCVRTGMNTALSLSSPTLPDTACLVCCCMQHAGPRASGHSPVSTPHLSTGAPGHRPESTSGFYTGPGVLNSGPQSHAVKTLPTSRWPMRSFSSFLNGILFFGRGPLSVHWHSDGRGFKAGRDLMCQPQMHRQVPSAPSPHSQGNENISSSKAYYSKELAAALTCPS